MFPRTRYLEWARRLYGKVRFDLATSGIPSVPLAELGVPSLQGFDDPSAFEALREAIATYNATDARDVIAALGTTHALWLAYASLAAPGDEILVEDPAYEPLVTIAEGVGARVVRFRRDPGERFALDPQRIARHMTSRTRIVAVTNLHNPSGVRSPDDILRTIAEVAAKRGAYLLVDEVYAAFDALVDDRGVFRGSARRLAPNVVAVSSLTKCYGLGALRAGWLIGPTDVVARAQDTVTTTCGSLPLAHAHLACRAFARVGWLAERARMNLPGKRATVAAWVASLGEQGLTWSAPDEGLFALVTLPGRGDLTATIERAAREAEVLVAAGSFFGVPNGFRVAWSAPAPVLAEGLTKLGHFLAESAPRNR
jgi:aspartate/methionine/tyrosine aminotransferase